MDKMTDAPKPKTFDSADYSGNDYIGRMDKCPGLIARIWPDPDTECPLKYAAGRGAATRGEFSYYGGTDDRDPDPEVITCPDCEGYGLQGDDPSGQNLTSCKECDESGERPARSSAEWSEYYGADAAVPVRGSYDSTQARIFVCDWDDSPDTIVYLPTRSAESIEKYGTDDTTPEENLTMLEQDIKEVDRWIRGECYGFSIEPDPENPDTDAEAIAGQMESCGGFIGDEYAEDEAVMMLEVEYEAVQKERAERIRAENMGVMTR
jgi:hypothetical protein